METDNKIVRLLEKDARTTHVQIAEQVGLSRPAVTERVKKLEQTGVIAGYTAVVDPVKTGRTITAFISARQRALEQHNAREHLMRLLEDERVLEVHDVAGEDCFLLKVRCPDVGSLNEIVKRLGGPPFLMTTRTTIALESYFERVGGMVLYNNGPQEPGGSSQ